STTGTYSVSYTVTSSGCNTTQNFSVTISPAPAVPTLSYSQTAYCVSDSPTTPTFTPAGGTFSASPVGLSLNTSTGVIIPSTSTTGTYTVTYTVTLGSCSRQVTSNVTINPNPVITTFNYSSNTFCQNDPNPSPTVNPTGGSFASTAGLNINAVSGLINLATSTAGTYNISYTVTTGGCNATQNFSVTINALPITPTISYSQTSYCTTATNPSPTVSQTGGTFSASPAGLSINTSTGVINLAGSTAGSYTITYTLTNSCGSSNGTFNVSVVITPPTPTVSYPQASYCTTDANPSPTVSQAGGTFSASPAGLSINASTGVINLAGSTAGSYTITYTLANGSCTSSNTFAVTVVQTPNAPTTTNGTRCGAGSVVLTASGGTNGNYRWYQPDGTTLIAGETNNTYTTPSLAVASTTYFVSIVNGSCESTRVPVQALIQLTPTTITVTGVVTDVTTCNPANSGAVNISITGGQAPYTFTWSNGATTEDLSNLTAGSYTVTVRDFFNCQSVATSFIVGTSVPALTLTANASNSSINEGESSNLSVTGSQMLISGVWSPADGLSDVNSLTPVASPKQTTTYTITATDNRGCSATSQITIEVFGSELFVPNAFTPQSSDPKNQAFKVFGNGIGEITLRIFDKLGQIVYETNNVTEATTTGWNGTFNGKDLPTGVFTWELKGKYLTGNELNYKGKNSGTVLLVR
ncbi:MAG: gliding motility-associated C-terminal domain-containing protein, partial [Raineya sp.]|nr:gliding motility-associated C-terminal domain-containing protein [Raineya sp.]